ncbi:4-diphosphocytidyl-2C-methyl-D-erythritol kinase, partial [uncultured Corynebacterium sp.]|uniref:4-diphosphocytidyl-2C-methyl-D-erythritol kinase n=1 Tax=uncultured Corynebacterium sp. TaxID=159447 RepID=UPI0025F2E6C0
MTAPDLPDPAERTGPPRSAAATSQHLLPLWLGVGDRDPDGRHNLVTVRQALNLTETVTVTVSGRSGTAEVTGVVITGRRSGHDDARAVAVTAVSAVTAVVERYRRLAPLADIPRIHLDIVRGAPVTGTVTGADAADAAAALVATRELLHGAGAAGAGYALAPRPTDAELRELAASLGAEVPAHLIGGTVLETGLAGAPPDTVPVMARGVRHWALALDPRPLPCPEVFDRLDAQRDAAARGERPDVRAGDVTAVQRSLLTANPTELAGLLANDLQPAALSLR